MPIKFRCHLCERLLGISRSKAGQQVDCPHCGRTTRVPDLDGKVRPVDEPQLNPDDPKLAQAFRDLDELEHALPIKLPASFNTKNVVLEPLPVNAPKDLGLAPTSRPIQIEDNLKIDPLEELKPVLYQTPNQKIKRDRHKPSNVLWWLATVFFVLASFVLGFYAGKNYGSVFDTPPQTSTVKVEEKQISKPKPAVTGFIIQGQISYKLPSGDARPDRGARVFLLPSNYQGSKKLVANGLRGGDSQADFKLAKSELEQLKASVTLVNDNGRYEINCNEPGDYYIVVASRFADRADEEVTTALIMPVLSGFFEKPAEIAGKVGCHVHRLNLKEEPSITWDYVFAP